MANVAAVPAIGSAAHDVDIQQLLPNADLAPLPAGLPANLAGPLAWTGADFNGSEYVHVLSSADVAEITAAIAHFKELGLDGQKVSRENFPIPTLGAKLDALSRDVHEGRGFCVVRGINPDNFGVEDLMIVYLAVQDRIASQRGRQDARGNMLVHIVRDDSDETRAKHHRHSNKAITFHTEESCDVVGWLTRSTAAAGGKCIIASAYTIYNALAAQRPDLVRVLARGDWPFAFPYFKCRPVIFYQDSKLVMNFGRTPLLGSEAHPRPARLPTVSSRQIEALDAIEAIARDTQLEIQTQAGDMHFINNLAVLHRREGFTDGDAPVEKRHLVRMWLRSPEHGWKVPEELKDEWETTFDNESREVYHLEPMPPAFYPLRDVPN